MRLPSFQILMLVFSTLLVVHQPAQAKTSQREQQIEVALRMIGHQVLLNAGDSTSRVLPITQEGGNYRIQFETEIAFNPEQLAATVDSVIQATQLADNYILSVESCEVKSVVYSFQMGEAQVPDFVPCKMRDLPKACYNFSFTLLEPELPETSISTPAWISPLTYPVVALLLALIIGTFVILRKKRIQPSSENLLISLGEYQFDKRNTELRRDKERIELTSKEAALLSLLYETVNAPIEREIIMEKVWGDEGNYVGRTLDVFISKLRKKLDADPKVKIVNIRGVGYKLVINS